MGTVPARRLAAVLIAIVAFSLAIAAATPAFAYTITGKVVDQATGQPVPDGYNLVELALWWYDDVDKAWYRGYDYDAPVADGTYTLYLPYDAGLYRVQCYNDAGYAEQWWDHAPTAAEADTITVNYENIANIDFALQSTAPPQKKKITYTFGSDRICDYRFVQLTGTMEDAVSKVPLGSRLITIQSSEPGITDYKTIGTCITQANGEYTFIAKPTRATAYRALFAGDDTYDAMDTGEWVVVPRVCVTKPSGPVDVPVGAAFPSISYLWPKHVAGTKPVSVQCQHFESGHWVTKQSVPMLARDYGSYTRVGTHVSLGKTGRWRIRTVHAADAQNAATYTPWRYINAR